MAESIEKEGLESSQDVVNKLASSSVVSVSVMVTVAIVVGLLAFTGALYLGETGAFSLFTDEQVEQVSATKKAPKKGSYEDGYQSGLDFARKKLEARGLIPSLSDSTFQRIFNAEVKSVSGSDVVVEFDATQFDVFGEGMITKTVMIPNKVDIVQNVPKSSEAILSEYENYNKKAQNLGVGDGFIAPPSLYTIKKLKLSDLEVGDRLNIVSVTDISQASSFEASSVELAVAPSLEIPIVAPSLTLPPSNSNPLPIDEIPSIEDETVGISEEIADDSDLANELPLATEDSTSNVDNEKSGSDDVPDLNE